ncbi:HAD family hydrolase [Parachitinimonas caeni]|uniref:HAD family hydrolase n=1 Tax=Parachitinimonas caeni TaxID=3031301 RepID=A0ABT7DU04_9NEIS|nr:HAD family hydrolase [Parachitinimonas caeni]MDK2123546.1 HAD family hydrolase [Parachitinimonas caeni]
MTIQAVLFDLDDTLFDYSHASQQAIRLVHSQLAAPSPDLTHFAERHHHYLEQVHAEFIVGRFCLNDARVERFRRLFAELGQSLSFDEAQDIGDRYRAEFMRNRRAMAGARQLLLTLQAHARIAIVSNNAHQEQINKLRHIGLDDCIDALVTSESAGIAKPAAGIFLKTLDELGCRPDQAVMVGDNWDADIEGALAAGLRAVWLNRHGLAAPAQSEVPQLLSLEDTHAICRLLLSRND